MDLMTFLPPPFDSLPFTTSPLLFPSNQLTPNRLTPLHNFTTSIIVQSTHSHSPPLHISALLTPNSTHPHSTELHHPFFESRLDHISSRPIHALPFDSLPCTTSPFLFSRATNSLPLGFNFTTSVVVQSSHSHSTHLPSNFTSSLSIPSMHSDPTDSYISVHFSLQINSPPFKLHHFFPVQSTSPPRV